MNNCEDDFPTLDINFDWDFKIKTLWFNLSRKSVISEIRELFNSILELSLSDNIKQTFIKRLILYIRDIGSGKGEQLLSYMMLFELYGLFPDEAYGILELFLTKYGSWRDVPYMCDYISKTSSRDHKFINIIVTMMNDRLYLDMKKAENNEPISNAAKWVPREGSKFTWLFNLLLDNWTLRYHPYLFRTSKTPEQRTKARCKAAAIYRKVFTLLSSKLGLVEVKLCNGIEFFDIDPLMINKKTMSKQWHSSYDMNFDSHDNLYHNKNITSIKIRYPMKWLVNASVRSPILIQNNNINSLWQNMISDKKLGSFIPMIDISSSVFKTGNIQSIIGNAMMIAKHSTIGLRISFLGNEPLWYNRGELLDDDYLSLLKDISNFLPHFSISNIIEGIKQLLGSIVSCNMNSDDISKLHLVIFTDQGFSSMIHHEIESLFHNKGLTVPRIIYWNISDKFVDIDSGLFIKDPFFLSGNDPSNFDALFQISKSNTCFSQYELIHLIVSRYH